MLSWEQRSRELRELIEFDDGRIIPAMLFEPSPLGDEWDALRAAWIELPSHPTCIDALATRGNAVVLRFAAINWDFEPLGDNSDWGGPFTASTKLLAAWGAQLVDLYQLIARVVPPSQWRLFTCPLVKVDVGWKVRVAFLPPSHNWSLAPPEGMHGERALVHVAGAALRDLVLERKGSRIADQIAMATHSVAAKRYESLAKLAEAFGRVGPPKLRDDVLAADWRHVEEGLGWLCREDYSRAFARFKASTSPEHFKIVDWGLDLCGKHLDIMFRPRRGGSPPAPIAIAVKRHRIHAWPDIASKIRILEAERAFDAALELYEQVILDEHACDVHVARALCLLEMNRAVQSIDDARRALAIDASRSDARAVLTRALLVRRQHAEALAEADYLVTHAADDADAHYLRGKALLALGRLREARDVFDLALSIEPKLVEAMLLRREADRMLKQLGQVVGSQQTQIEIPESLEELRPVLLSGRTFEAIAALSQARWAENLDAQLLLAQFVLQAGDPDGAIAIYDGLTDAADPHRHIALIGKANVLLDQGHLESALALFESLIADQPSDLDAIEGRARTLDRLGRTGEAAAEFRRFVSLASAGTDLRVRAAQMWLEHH